MAEAGTVEFDILERTTRVLDYALSQRQYDAIIIVTKRGSCLYDVCYRQNKIPVYSDIFLASGKAAVTLRGKTVLLFDDSARYGRHLFEIRKALIDMGVDESNLDIYVVAQYEGYDKLPIHNAIPLTMSDMDIFAKRSLYLFYANKTPYLRFQPTTERVSHPGLKAVHDRLEKDGFIRQDDTLFDKIDCRYYVKALAKEELIDRFGASLGGLIEIAYIEAYLYDVSNVSSNIFSYQIAPRMTLSPLAEHEILPAIHALLTVLSPAFPDTLLMEAYLQSETRYIQYLILSQLLAILLYYNFVPESDIKKTFDFHNLSRHFGIDWQNIMLSMNQEKLSGLDFRQTVLNVTPISIQADNIPDTIKDLEMLFSLNGIEDALINADQEGNRGRKYDFRRVADRFAGGCWKTFIFKYAKCLAEGSAVDHVEHKPPSQDGKASGYFIMEVNSGEMSFMLAKKYREIFQIFFNVGYRINDSKPNARSRAYQAVVDALSDIVSDDHLVKEFKDYYSFFNFSGEPGSERRIEIFDTELNSLIFSLWENNELTVSKENARAFREKCGNLIERLTAQGLLTQ